MAVTAAMVKELRERTGAGMMECKKALVETNGEKASRVAADGQVMLASNDDNTEAVLVEVNSETDFVAKDANFLAFAKAVANNALAAQGTDVNALMESDSNGTSLEVARQASTHYAHGIQWQHWRLCARWPYRCSG